MRTIVSKFGGSSTANAAQFIRILGLVRASPARRCVVLSAPGTDSEHGEKVTALLETCWRNRKNRSGLEDAVSKVVARFRELARGLSMPDMDDLVKREVLEAAAVSLPRTLSRGEYLCALLFSRWSGIPAVDAAGLVAFDSSGALDCERTLSSFRALPSAHGGPVIVPGFYGADPKGEIVTFPRNGSDITGALAAAGLDAGLYENWTDVPGLMTADPSVVPEARLVPQVSYRQMRALARAGAQVLHPACLDPVAMAGIPTRLRCTNDPDSFGTLIDEHTEGYAPCIAFARRTALPHAPGEYAACISVFGVPGDRALEAAERLDARRVEALPHCVRVYVDQALCAPSVRKLHRRLIE